MKKQQLRWVISLMALATLAIVGLQGYIWNQSIRWERELFSEKLQAAVFEATEALLVPWQSSIMAMDSSFFRIRRDSLDRTATFQVDTLDSTFAIAFIRQQDRVMVRPDSAVDSFVFRSPGQKKLLAEHLHTLALPDSMHVRFSVNYDPACPSCDSPSLDNIDETLKPLLKENLLRQGISADFDWGVRQVHSGAWLLVEGDTARVQASAWQYPMFSFAFDGLDHRAGAAGVFSPPTLSLYFPSENWHLVRNIAITLGASAVLALLVLGCMAYAMHLILRQKKLSEVKTEFINNMTHEFKTPISTIALACEALQDDGVTVSQGLRDRYMQMIAVENERLAAQVEKVLQMALLDRKDLGLNREPVDLHTLVEEVGDAFSMQIRQRGGRLKTVLEAHPAVVEGDGLHLRQMVSNLLDNATKYSPEAPDIRITTRTRDGGVEIAVRDRGLGISREALRKIYDRFYRVSTGNRHDVKGFGLGLSYVQSMAMAHGGHIRATSKPGAGSTFYLFLPYRHA